MICSNQEPVVWCFVKGNTDRVGLRYNERDTIFSTAKYWSDIIIRCCDLLDTLGLSFSDDELLVKSIRENMRRDGLELVIEHQSDDDQIKMVKNHNGAIRRRR